jgi:hypothetical protein
MLRLPIEVKRAKMSWVNLEDSEVNISNYGVNKNEARWNHSIKSRTEKALNRWLD